MLGELKSRWVSRRERRRAADEALAAETRERIRKLVREISQPLVEAGVARVDWDEPDPKDYADAAIDLVPAREGAAAVSIDPAPDWVTLSVATGSMEIFIDDKGEWERELRKCLEAVVDGRYSEDRSAGHLGHRLAMTFELPGEEDFVYTILATYKGAGEGHPPGKLRYVAYG